MTTYETLLCEIDDGVALVTLNRPEVLNAFNPQMEADLAHLWQALQHDDDVRCVVLTGAGDRAFCVGIDRDATIGAADESDGHLGYSTPWVFDDPGKRVGPKANELWKPVIGAVRGMACGGAFYILGETDFIIAGRSATFFDPHVTFQMPAAYEPIHMLQKMPLQEVLRMSLLGAHERMSAQRAYEVGLVSEVVDDDAVIDAAMWAAAAIASASPLVIQGTLRAIWMGNEVPRSQALDLCSLYTRIGIDPAAMQAGQQEFGSKKRIEWRSR
ncbi:MAG: enoyl-CoA hydratase/isomerase family protein [Acidimicrobiales bacterium]